MGNPGTDAVNAQADDVLLPRRQAEIAELRPDPYSDELYGKTNLITNWYKRNLRIFTNLYRISEPGERMLLLIGSGHLSILRRLAIDAPDICLVDAEPYLR